MQVPVYNLAREVIRQIEVSDYVFAVPFNETVVHQAMLRQRADARQGTASSKTRGEVSGSTRKLFRQKGTGLARAGSRRSPVRRGGGIVFGPKPRSYQQAMPKKMRRLALRCVLSAKLRDKELMILEELKLPEAKTKEMVRILTSLGANSSVLIVTSELDENMVKSARNLPETKTMLANLLNVVDIISYKMLLMTVAAVSRVEELWGKNSTGEGHATLPDITPPVNN